MAYAFRAHQVFAAFPLFAVRAVIRVILDLLRLR